MASYVSLRDITTSPKSKAVEMYHVVRDDDILDEIEYCLGLERGGIDEYRDNDLLRAELHSDMVKLLKNDQWALVPSGQALKSILELFEGNHTNGPSNRTLFTVAIPPQTPYEYRFMGLKQRKGKFFFANGKKYEFPFDDFPIVRSNLHPCFLFTTLIRCTNVGLIDGRKHLMPLGNDQGLASSAFFTLNRFFHISWLGNTVAANFPNRRIPTVRTNPIAASAPSPNQADTDREVEPTPPPETSTPERTRDVNVVQSPPQPERTPPPLEARFPVISSTQEPVVVLEAGAPQKKRKIAQASPATEDGSTARPAKRRSPRFTSS